MYSLDDSREVDLQELRDSARALYQLKGAKSDDPRKQEIGDYLANEYIRVFGLPVPESMSPTIPCHISTTYFVRRHLPERRLCSALLPLLVDPEKPHVAMVLPARYWPPEFVDEWVRGAC